LTLRDENSFIATVKKLPVLPPVHFFVKRQKVNSFVYVHYIFFQFWGGGWGGLLVFSIFFFFLLPVEWDGSV